MQAHNTIRKAARGPELELYRSRRPVEQWHSSSNQYRNDVNDELIERSCRHERTEYIGSAHQPHVLPFFVSQFVGKLERIRVFYRGSRDSIRGHRSRQNDVSLAF